MTVMEWCVSEAKDLRFIGKEFNKRGEELRNDRSANLSLVETGGYMEFVCNGDGLILNLLLNFEPMKGFEH